MPIISLQRRIVRTGAIRLGNRVPKKDSSGNVVLDRRGIPIMLPNKLNTFRVTSPHREVIDAVAEQFGGKVFPWQGDRGPEFEVITDRSAIAVLVPPQRIDPNYEFWGKRLKVRFCDGETERIRGVPCLCQQWDNHEHRFVRERCVFCGLDQRWNGEPHVHEFDMGECVHCGCTRLCKPTTRVNVMIQGIPGIGVFKIESHGINAAIELPTLTEMIEESPKPLPGVLGMRPEERTRMTRDGKIETRQFFVPELHFPWARPEMLFANGRQLEQAARETITCTVKRPAITATPVQSTDQGKEDQEDQEEDEAHQLTRADILHLALAARTLDDVRALWKDARTAGCLDKAMERTLADRANELKNTVRKPHDESVSDVVDAEIIEE